MCALVVRASKQQAARRWFKFCSNFVNEAFFLCQNISQNDLGTAHISIALSFGISLITENGNGIAFVG